MTTSLLTTVNMFSAKIDKFKMTNIDDDMLVNYAVNEKWNTENIKLHELDKFKSFYSIYEDKINQVYHTSYGKNYKLKISGAWCAVGNTKNVIIPHNHKESFLSAVYYPQADNEELWFINPMPQLSVLISERHVEEHDEYNSDYWNVKVNTGDLLIFNSMIHHYITPTKHQRISFAIDSIIVPN